jgi:DNA-binding CsgD family transcriptional regulator
MTPNAALAHLRQLACLGVGAGIAMPDVLEVITSVVPSGNNMFLGTDDSYLCRSLVMLHSTPDLLETLFAKRATDYKSFCDHHEGWWRAAPSAVTLDDEGAAYPGLHKSPVYFECMRPFGQHHLLEGLVRKGGRPAGYLHLCREHSARKFSQKDVTRLASVLPYVALTLSDRPTPDMLYAPAAATGVLVIDAKGRIQHHSLGAETLLRYALSPQLREGKASRESVFGIVAQLLRRLRVSMTSVSVEAGEAPLIEVRNDRGLFTFRAHWLTGDEYGASCRACVIIDHAEPLPLRIMRGLAQLPLSPAQKRVALLIACGRTRERIAKELCLSQETVKDYARRVYARLGVHDRHQLMSAALSVATAGNTSRASFAARSA